MFKIFSKLNIVGEKTKTLLHKYKNSDIEVKKQVHWILIFATILLALICIAIGITNSNSPQATRQDIQIEQREDLPKGLPNPLDIVNPFKSFQEGIIDGVSEIIKQAVGLFDDYVGFTPNIARNDGEIKDSSGKTMPMGFDKFYRVTMNIAWALLPLVIVLYGAFLALEGGFRGVQLLQQISKKVLLFIIAMVSMRFVFGLFIDLNNGINSYLLQNLLGSPKLSDAILNSLGLAISDNKLTFSIEGVLNTFGEIILWIGLFFMLMTLLFQFVIRFFHLLLHVLMFPIVLIISLLPGGEQFFKNYVEELLRSLFLQPIFLVGLAIVIQIISSVNQPVPKVILGLGSLAFMNLIPSIVNRFSGILWGLGGSVAGGLLATATVANAGKLKDGVVTGLSGGKTSSIRNLAGKTIGETIISRFPSKSSAIERAGAKTNMASSKLTYQSSEPAKELYPTKSTQNGMRQFSEKPSNPNSKAYTVQMGRTFDTGSKEHWNNLTSWYRSQKDFMAGRSEDQLNDYLSTASNKREIINEANNGGFFSQNGIRTIKLPSEDSGEISYLQIPRPKKKDAGDSTTQTK